MLIRPRRNRMSNAVRGLVQETHLLPQHLVYPLFIIDGVNIRNEIKSLPNVFQLSLDNILLEIEECIELGIHSFIMFPVIDEALKDKIASYSYHKDNFYLKAIPIIKNKFPNVCLISDIAMDPYSSDGHDGIVHEGKIINDETVKRLTEMAVMQAQAGADMIGPSDMMDGRVRAIREALDASGYTETSIMSYTAKYASAFYGPFRDALDSAPKSGDKKTYQMNPANVREALLEANLDTEEGADILMVKPALSYLDVIQTLKQNSNLPIAAYNVSGEFSMIKAAAAAGYLDHDKVMQEVLLSMKRAGADIILTYFAKEFAKLKN
ncbi:MAG: porphobilinogen synthase [Bacteroidetes bacterium]|nr:porphobilinogen synthase [Bacteroidota bacterium]